MIRSLFRAFAAIAAMASLGQPLPAHAADGWKANADDALLFEVRLGQYRIGDGVRAYRTPEGVCVDFADVTLALDIPIRIDKKSHRASGWAFDEHHTIEIDRDSGIEHIANTSRRVAPHDIYDTAEGWCVDTHALGRWLAVTLTADTGNAVLFVRSDKKLPPQAAAERRARVGSARPTSFDLASLPHSTTALRGTPLPAVDVVASLGAVHDRVSGSRFDAQYELYAAGHAGPVGYNARLSSDRSGVPLSLRVQAYRTEPLGGLLGPLNATTIAAGDVVGVSTPLVSNSTAGRGALITNRPVERADRFGKIDLRGELPRGWDAELYRNGQLIAFAQERADGRYEFLDVALQYGTNRLEVVLYGPQGQIRREERNVPVGLDSIPPRKTYYWLGVDEDGRDLIRLGRAAYYGAGGWRGSFGVERGLDVRTSVAAYAHSLIVDGLGRHNYLEGSLRRALGPALVEASASLDVGGGRALRLQALGQFGKTRYDIETIWAHDYRSDRVQAGVTGLHSLTIDRVFGNGRHAVPVDLTARLTTRRTGDDSIELAARASTGVGRLALTGEVAWREERHQSLASTDRLEVGLLANARVGRLRLRGEMRASVLPGARFESATVVGEWTAGQGNGQIADLHAPSWRAEVGYDRVLSRARAGLGYIRRFDRFAMTATGEVASDGSVAAGLGVAFSLGANPRTGGGVRMVADKLAARGSVLVRVYRDVNGNGRRDVGEPWASEVGVTAGRVPVDAATDIRGETVADGLEPYRPVMIGIDAASLPDPFVRPAIPGVVVTPRPGTVAVIELPLVGTGDIDGTLVRQSGGTLEGVDLELIDSGGRTVARSRSDFDGFFLFETVPYGRYSLRVAELSAAAIRAAPALSGEPVVSAKSPSVHLGAIAVLPLPRQAAK